VRDGKPIAVAQPRISRSSAGSSTRRALRSLLVWAGSRSTRTAFRAHGASAQALEFPALARAAWDEGVAVALAPVRGAATPDLPGSMRVT